MTNEGGVADPWVRPRVCVVCGNQYSLATHGTVAAKAAVQGMAQGLDPAVLGAEISKCPVCLSARRMSEQEAVAAAMAIGTRMRQGHDEQTYRYVRRAGGFAAAAGLLSILIVLGYEKLRGDAFNPLPWYLLSGMVSAAGLGVFIFARASARSQD